MATIRLSGQIWEKAYHHLFDEPGEHFVFFLANWTYSRGEPVFLVQDSILVSDDKVSIGWEGYGVDLEVLLEVINTANKRNFCVVEAHNHGGTRPRFSTIDQDGLQEFVAYILDSLKGRPYAATVWGDTTVSGRYFLPDGSSGEIDSISVTGNRFMQIASIDNDSIDATLFDRQLPWFTLEGQRQLAHFHIGVVGCGGVGAQLLQNLAYLGCRNFVLIEDDIVEDTNMNRLVSATPADIGTPKAITARRMIRSIAKEARVLALDIPLRVEAALDALKGVDMLFGCVDNDGARLILNELSLAYGIPYIDAAVGIEARDGVISEAGGRMTVILPDGPCLYCMGQIDTTEASYFLATPEQQRFQIQRGYVSGMNIKAPSVVSLNALIAAAAVNEFAVYVSGARPINTFTEYDIIGTGRKTKSQWMTPTIFRRDESCVECGYRGIGDKVNLERYLPHK